MPRLSSQVKAAYKELESDYGSEACYFCGNVGVMDELTPNPKATSAAKATFEEWTIVRACQKCWRKIYTANINKAGIDFGVSLGAMTLEQKVGLCTSLTPMKYAGQNGYTFMAGTRYVLPTDSFRVGEEDSNTYVCKSQTVYKEELDLLQGPMILKMQGAEEEIVRKCFYTILLDKQDLSKSRKHIYYFLMGYDYVPSMDDED